MTKRHPDSLEIMERASQSGWGGNIFQDCMDGLFLFGSSIQAARRLAMRPHRAVKEDHILERVIAMAVGDGEDVGHAPEDIAHVRRMIGVGLERLAVQIDPIESQVWRLN